MAEEVAIANTTNIAKIRNPVGTFFLTLITLGIYGIFWYYYINREMRDLGRAHGTAELGESPGTSVLAITLGAIIIVPAIMSLINTHKRITAAQRLYGVEEANGWIALILYVLLGPAMFAYWQSNLNKVWQGQGGAQLAPGGTPAAAVQPPAQAPAQQPQAPPPPPQQQPPPPPPPPQ
jgi:hypothetical protein